MEDDALTDWSDTRLLAAILGSRAAECLLARFGSVRQLLQARPRDVLGCHGVGRARLAALRVLPELARRYYRESLPSGEVIRSPADTECYLHARMRDLEHEVFCCLFLDNRHRVLCFDELFRGTIDGTSVYPREVVKEALAINAAAVICSIITRAEWPSPARRTSASRGGSRRLSNSSISGCSIT
jgi:DNA repair protein RadC